VDLQPSDVAGKPIAFMMLYVRQRPWAHAAILTSVLIAVLASVGSQYAVKHLVDVMSAHNVAGVWMAFLLLAGLIATDNLTWRIGGWIATHAFVAVTGDMRSDLFRYLTGHAASYFADRLPGTLAGRVTATANAIYTVESVFAWNVLPPIVAIVFSIALLLSVNWAMALVLVVGAALVAFILVRLAANGQSLHQQYASNAASVDGELVDVLTNMPLVRAFGAIGREHSRFNAHVQGEVAARRRSLRYLEKLRLFHAATTAALTAGVLGWAIWQWERGHESVGDVVLVSTLGATILHGSRDLAVAMVELVQHVARVSEALTTLLEPHGWTDVPDAHPLHLARGAVTFERVTFAYRRGHPVLRDFRLTVRAGDRVGLVGRSGSGKSTVLALLQRLLVADRGRVLIDGQDIISLTQESLQDAISVVPQEVMLFHRSLRENLRYGRPDATDEEVLAAADAASCTGFINDLPEGIDTIVGDRGAKLSGGQRQRIAIARAFLRNAPILLLDEATSALDSESEQAVQAALDRLIEGRTVIAVAHRLSTLRNFDRILVMQSGRIVQDGPPRELERKAGPFRDLLSGQMALPDV
jgi:ATP-binding cassette subfamily B protein